MSSELSDYNTKSNVEHCENNLVRSLKKSFQIFISCCSYLNSFIEHLAAILWSLLGSINQIILTFNFPLWQQHCLNHFCHLHLFFRRFFLLLHSTSCHHQNSEFVSFHPSTHYGLSLYTLFAYLFSRLTTAAYLRLMMWSNPSRKALANVDKVWLRPSRGRRKSLLTWAKRTHL